MNKSCFLDAIAFALGLWAIVFGLFSLGGM
jgi:hypothetical protein